MQLNSEILNDYRLHAITIFAGASAMMSQMDEIAQYSPVAAGIAFLLSATSYKQLWARIDDLADAMADADIISDEDADDIDGLTDVMDEVSDLIIEE